jgi:hypothetical protein
MVGDHLIDGDRRRMIFETGRAGKVTSFPRRPRPRGGFIEGCA